MSMMNLQDLLTAMLIGQFLLGVLTFGIGVGFLIFRTAGREQQTIAAQAARLAQKGLAEEIAGLVGNASGMLVALNELVRTAAGIGIFLILIGLFLMISSVWVVLQLP